MRNAEPKLPMQETLAAFSPNPYAPACHHSINLHCCWHASFFVRQGPLVLLIPPLGMPSSNSLRAPPSPASPGLNMLWRNTLTSRPSPLSATVAPCWPPPPQTETCSAPCWGPVVSEAVSELRAGRQRQRLGGGGGGPGWFRSCRCWSCCSTSPRLTTSQSTVSDDI